jgi:hypothetical protein
MLSREGSVPRSEGDRFGTKKPIVLRFENELFIRDVPTP